ncbi:MAG: hypothetical protein KME23_11335 [Goleter apudmare HA4340-LM2]|jgi:hypothetical protein|nr:hypothetical protein [Goleter apudmare HA4340-LM2]
MPEAAEKALKVGWVSLPCGKAAPTQSLKRHSPQAGKPVHGGGSPTYA